ncbi:hypothetical protein ACEPPN_005851 [Leptodophora sp. 'Broadleaf-Isolate-01']
MASNMESTFQDSQGDEYFDFDAASAGVADAMLSSNTAQDFEMGSSPWSETLHDYATVNNDYQQHGTLANDMFQLSDNFAMDNFAMDNSAWAEIGPTLPLQPTSNTAVKPNLPDHFNIWDHDSSLSQNNGFQFCEMESSASAGTHNHLDSDPATQTILEPWYMGCAPPPEGRQSGVALSHQKLSKLSDHKLSDLMANEPEHDQSVAVTARSRRVIRCPWPSCVADDYLFRDEAEASVHLKSHQDAMLLGPWNGPIKCSWPNCSSETVFKHKYLLKTHLANIHVAPLRCTIAGCSYSEPFGKQHDLDRHVSAIHGGSRYLCTVESCDSSTIGFARKDKLVKHMREEHDNVRCTLNHCDYILPDGEQESHLQKFHGTYECALGACERGLPSYFSKEAVRLHLISVHKIYRETASMIVDRSKDNTIRPNVVRMRRQFVECQCCWEHLHAAN